MRIILKSLHIENFKGIKLLDVVFGIKTKIKGQNASGKTTIFDSFTWLLFNKNSAGEEKFNIRPLDAEGNRVDNVEIKVAAVLEVDGNEVELSKSQRQNWVKHRGSTALKLEGNVNSFEIDRYPKTEVDYKAYISSLVSEGLFKILTNPQYFSNMKWKDQRDILTKFASGISDVELAQSDPEFTDLIPELDKAPSTDDIQKKFSKALSEWKKKQQEIPVRIDELSKSLVQIDIAEQELAKSDLERRIAELDAQIADSSKAMDSLISESMELQFAINGLYAEANDKLTHDRRALENAKYEASKSFENAHREISESEKKIESNNTAIELSEKKRSELGEQYKKALQAIFDEKPYAFDESKWVFDESGAVCSLCGQNLPEDKIAEIKADFQRRKEKAKTDAEKLLAKEKEEFEKHKSTQLENIRNDGFAQKQFIEDYKAENGSLEKKIEELKELEIKAMAKQNELSKQLSELPDEPDMSDNAEYQQKKTRYDEIEKQIVSLKDSASITAAFNAERSNLSAELDIVKAEIAKASKNVEIEERIGELKAEQEEVGQKVADQEKMLYLLESFIRAKMLKISDSINQHFKTVNFKLFEIQLNGGMKECCECTVNGVPYSTLNSGHHIIAGLDIIQSLSELYGVTAPIFIDNAESLNEFNVPDMEAQMILLSVSDDKELKVEVE